MTVLQQYWMYCRNPKSYYATIGAAVFYMIPRAASGWRKTNVRGLYPILEDLQNSDSTV